MRRVVLIHGETTRVIIGHCFDVANELGLGFREGDKVDVRRLYHPRHRR